MTTSLEFTFHSQVQLVLMLHELINDISGRPLAPHAQLTFLEIKTHYMLLQYYSYSVGADTTSIQLLPSLPPHPKH